MWLVIAIGCILAFIAGCLDKEGKWADYDD